MDVPKVQVEEIYLDVEGLDAHLMWLFAMKRGPVCC
jgi:hypothetical protein